LSMALNAGNCKIDELHNRLWRYLPQEGPSYDTRLDVEGRLKNACMSRGNGTSPIDFYAKQAEECLGRQYFLGAMVSCDLAYTHFATHCKSYSADACERAAKRLQEIQAIVCSALEKSHVTLKKHVRRNTEHRSKAFD